MRDWTKTLFPASYKGVPFWVEMDAADTGRRLNVAEFPGIDEPYIEDLGRRKRCVEVTGYFIGDVSDVEMTALEAVCDTPGPGLLVMPAQGPVSVFCETIKRRRQRDKMGRFGFEARFIRAGLTAPMAATSFLAQAVFDAGDALAAAAPSFVGQGMSL